MIGIMHRLMNQTGRYKARIRWSYLTSFIKGIMMKMPMFLTFLVISFFMENTMTGSKCLYVGIAVLVSVALEALFEHLTNVLQSAAGYEVFADMRMALGEHLRKMPMGYFTEGNMGKISSVLSADMVFIEENCMGVLAECVSFLISQMIMIATMFYMDIRIGILSVLVVCLFVLVGNLMLKNTMSNSIIKQECNEKLTDAVLDFAEGIGIIKSYNLLGEKSKSLSDNFEKTCEEALTYENKYAPWSWGLYMTHGLGTVGVLALAAYLYLQGTLSGTYLIGIILFWFDVFGSIKAYYSQMARLTVTAAALDRIESVFDAAELEDNGTGRVPETAEYEIEYDNVTFGYTNEDVLQNVSFKAKSGEMVALVGPSGGGKSTIASLMARFWDVKSGSIKLRGKDIRDIPISELMDNISMVFQRVYLFQNTIYNNIIIGRPDATENEVIEAAKKARCYEFIMALPDGFNTVVGEGGASLSGGEKQRISIARCILKDSPIVILDEATASVDADNEKAIQEAISELCRDKTLLVIAHRLKTIKDADQILLIDNKGISEEGNHESLVAKNGKYSKMWCLAETS